MSALPFQKIAHLIPVTKEMLEDFKPALDADVSRWRIDQERRHAREDARQAELIAAGGVGAALAQLHAPDERRECNGCDFDGWEAERPEWPCRTWVLLDEHFVA
jgi:hypothetical protein